MFKNVNVQQALELVKRGVVVVDVREPAEWARGHLPGARLVSLSTLRASPEEHLPKRKVLFVCAAGVRSAIAARLAAEIGVTEIYNLVGGTTAWANAGHPITAELDVAV